jgi:hypothetical protein
MEPNPTGPTFTRRAQRNAARDAGPPPRIGTAVARFMLGSLLAIAVVVGGGFLALRSVAVKEAVRDTRERVEAEGRLVQAGRHRRRPAAPRRRRSRSSTTSCTRRYSTARSCA